MKEIYPGLKVNDELTLGDELSFKHELGAEISDFDWPKLNREQSVSVIKAFVQSASATPIPDLEHKVKQIPSSQVIGVLKKIPALAVEDEPNTDETKAKSGNLKEQVSKKPTKG